MRLSDAILLGSTVLNPKAGGQHFAESQSGCALGMAAVARGCTFGRVRGPINEWDRRTLGTEDVWGKWVLQVVARPCDCWVFRVSRKMRIKDIIAHLFDHHVMSKKDWTVGGIALWLRAWEPKEVAFPEMPRPDSRPSTVGKREWRRQEEEEWQAVRQSFEAKYPALRRRGPVPRSSLD